jgi:uncharacterized membrane protein
MASYAAAAAAAAAYDDVTRSPGHRAMEQCLRTLRDESPAPTQNALGFRPTLEQGVTMEVGPVDVYIIGFPGNKFSGKIAPAIRELVDSGTIRILDLLFVMKDGDGTVTTLAIEDLDAEGAAFAELDITEPGSLNDEDADEVSEDLPANSAALLIAFENVWATKVVTALADADAVLIDSIRIPAEVVAQARAESGAAG